MHFRNLVAGIILLLAFASPALAERRVALVIGNSAYKNVSRLANPANDATAIENVFKASGFDSVESRRDLSIVETRKVLRDFTARSRDADVAVVYYAGHGIEVDGVNYVIPVDAVLEQDTDIYDEAFSLDRVLVTVEAAKQLRLVILDACRDNPFAKTMRRSTGTRAIGRGLAKVEPTNPNTMIAFAAKAGSTASDGDGKNSPFAAALVRHIVTPGLDLRKAFGFVRDDVMKVTNNRQEPYVYGSLGGNDVSLVPVTPAPAPVVPPSINSDARRDYDIAVAAGTKEVWDAFILSYPSGFYTSAAKAQRSKLIAEEERVLATEKAVKAESDKARLATEHARAAEQAQAALLAKAAEEKRILAERKKAAEDAKVEEAERAKVAALAKAAEAAKVAQEKKQAAEDAKLAEIARKAAAIKAAEDARLAKESTDKAAGTMASLAPAQESVAVSEPPKTDAIDVSQRLQSELLRVGCSRESAKATWDSNAQQSLMLFNKHAGTKLDVKLASLDALDLVRSKPGRICPLVCERGYKADGEACRKVVCRAGYEVDDDNTCIKIDNGKPQAKRKPAEDVKPARAVADSQSRPQASGQMVCGLGGCRPLSKGCRIGPSAHGAARVNDVEICN